MIGAAESEKLVESSDRLATSRAERKAQSRRRIIEAARDVFFRDGFMAANLDEVAERAGVAKGTLYRYFESKADLYVAVLADNGDVFVRKMADSADATPDSATAAIESMSRFYLDWWVRHNDYFQIFWAIDNEAVIGQLPEQVVSEVTRLWEESLQILDRLIRQGVENGEFAPCNSWAMANMLWTTANSLIQSDSTWSRRRLRRTALADVFEEFISLFLRGMSTKP